MKSFLRLALAGALVFAPLPVAAQDAGRTSAETAMADIPDAEPAVDAVPDSSTLRTVSKIDTAAFAARGDYLDTDVSPDGRRFVFSKIEDGKVHLAFFDAETLEALRTVELGSGFDLEWLHWAGNGRVLYSLGGKKLYGTERLYFSRLFVYDYASNKQHYIGFSEQALIGDDVIFTDSAGRFALLDVSKSIYSWPDVWRFPLDGSGEDAAAKIQSGREGVGDWVADDSGVVRLGYGRLRSGRTYITYRSGPDDSWRRVARVKRDSAEEDVWDGIGMFAGSDRGYSLIPDDEGRESLYEFDYASGEVGKLVHQVPDQSIEHVLGTEGRIQGVSYTDDASRTHWFDPALAETQRKLEAALPGTRVSIISRSKDDARIIVYTGDEGDPGALYVFTPAERRLELFNNVRPDIDMRDLARPRAVDIMARDGERLRAYLTLPKGRDPAGLPLIVLPHGGPFGVRDTLSYDDEVQLLANRGYAVIQPNYRGSGGYGESFVKLGEGQVGRGMQDDLDDARAWVVAEGIADPARVCVVGSSYGGYAALWAVSRNPELYRCAASWAGVTDWGGMLAYDRNYLGRYGYRKQKARLRGEEGIELDEFSPLRAVSGLSRPVLIAHGKKDRRVPFEQYVSFVEAAKKADRPIEILELDDGHSFTETKNEQAWYDALEAFLAKHNPAD